MIFDSPQRIDRYSLQAAFDHPERNPSAWKLLGMKQGSVIYETLHEEINAVFNDLGGVKDYRLPQASNTVFESVQLQILSANKRGNGVQLAQIAFWRQNDAPNQQ